MGLTQLYYKAFRAFRHHTQNDADSKKLRKAIHRAKQSEDVLTSIKYDCIIDSDWIENIEEGLVYIEKAIQEERQFIRTEGEVIPIEKVKRVSKASVEHLAKHSNLITRVPKDKKANLIPEKLYMVEKLTDYQVYENRFLYMLLCYLKDFIQMRLDHIKDKTTTFEAKVNMQKELDDNQRHLKYALDYHDLYKNDPYLIDQYHQIPLVDRIENIYALVVSFLSTPLMKEVSKAPLIKPPVIKTNVLRMNPNFRAALNLYDYVTAYSKDGYTITEMKQTLTPFPKDVGDEIIETIQLTSNLAYIVGNDLSKTLAEHFKAMEEEQKKQKAMKHKDELKRLKKRMIEMEEDASEYILKLEKRNIELEKHEMDLETEKERNEALQKRVKLLEESNHKLKDDIKELRKQIADKTDALNAMNQKYFEDMTEAETIHQEEMRTLKEKHIEEINQLNTAHEANVQAIKTAHANEMEALKETHRANLQALNEEYEAKRNALIQTHETQMKERQAAHDEALESLNVLIEERDESIKTLQHDIEVLTLKNEQSEKAYDKKIVMLNKKIDRLEDEKKFATAQYKALKSQQGLMEDEDFTSKQKFKQLEMEMEAYKKLFKEQWKKAKSQIRQKVKDETFNEDSDNTQS